jgi:4-diphosphocytidyl-2-C-methyl-D-erythritol kinase
MDAMNNDSCALRVGCKINLHLEILGRREDGYHELRTLFLPLDEPSDTIHIRPAELGASMLLTCSDPSLENQGNILLKTYRAFSYVTSTELDIEVHLDKGTPVGAGLGGGSADAAAFLLYLNQRVPRPLSPIRLRQFAVSLGADVAFFLENTPAWGAGVGEILTHAPHVADLLRGMSLILISPELHVSTGRAYAAWDATFLEKNKQIAPEILTVDTQSLIEPFCVSAITLWNCFEAVVFPAYPELRDIKEQLLRRGAAGALMSGSGSSVFALFRSASRAETVADEFRRTYSAVYVHHFC